MVVEMKRFDAVGSKVKLLFFPYITGEVTMVEADDKGDHHDMLTVKLVKAVKFEGLDEEITELRLPRWIWREI